MLGRVGRSEGDVLMPLNERLAKSQSRRTGTSYTDGLFMTSRDGRTFKRWGEAFIRPGLQQEGRWVYGDNYQNWGLLCVLGREERRWPRPQGRNSP